MSRPLCWTLVGAAAVVWLFLPTLLPSQETVLVLLALYVPVVVGISLLAGYAGQVSLGQAAFFGIGAYGTGILTVHAGLSPWLAMPAAAAAAGAAALLIGAPVFLLRGHYLVLATLGLNVIFEVVVREFGSVTGGASGLIAIPPLSIGETTFLDNQFFFYAASGLALVSMLLSARLVRSRIGRALQAIEGSETAAATLGVSRRRHATEVFAWSAVLAGASGALYAEWLRFLSPSSFSLDFSIELLIMAVIGGIASVPGALVGVALVLSLKEVLREVAPGIAGTGASGGASAEYELVLFGLLLAAVVIFMPEGIWPRLIRRRPIRRGDVESHALDPAAALDLTRPDLPPVEGPLLTVERVSRDFGGLHALQELSFTVERGEVFAIIGPNGAGKTTLLNLLSGVVTPSAGHMALHGREIAGRPPHEIARLGMARSFQTPRLFGLLSVADNVKAGLHQHLRAGFLRSLFGLNAREERSASSSAGAALRLVGANQVSADSPDSLPFGMLRLVELARSLASRPRLLLLDEPASGLGSEERDELKALIRGFRDRGITVILVEHDVPLVMELADRVLVLHHGTALAEGKPAEVASNEAVISAYLGKATGDNVRRRRHVKSEAESAPLLRTSQLCAGYGAVRVLHDVDLEVRAGEVVAVLGANGAGKTTLLRSMMGIIPSSGSRELEGAAIAGMSPEKIVRQGLSLVPEGRELFPGMTVHDHLLLGAFPRRGRSEQSALASDLSEVYDLFPILAERGEQRAETLSGGQQQMLAIARALMSGPRLLMLDEPLLGLAPLVVNDILDTVAALSQRGRGIVIVEQNATTVLPMVDRAYVLRQGRVAVSGRGTDLIADPSVRAAFLGAGTSRPLAEIAAENGESPGGIEPTTEEGAHQT